MEIILTKTPLRRFVNGVRQKGESIIVKPDELRQYGFSEAEIKRIAEDWDTNAITRRDSKFIYKASPKY